MQKISHTVVLYVLYFHLMYLSRPKSLDEYMNSLVHKISSMDLSSQRVNFMECCKKQPECLAYFGNKECIYPAFG
jgi:hypothetical protein